MARSGGGEKTNKEKEKEEGLKKGPWTPEEDQKLLSYIQQFGEGGWRSLSAKAGLKRCGKSCRLRWNNYLRPDIKKDDFTLDEERTIIQLHALLGNRWSAIASYLPKRTDCKIKNHWNSHIKKRLTKMGIDPVTHKPKVGHDTPPFLHGSNLNHMAQWEAARLEAEARLVHHPKKYQQPYPYLCVSPPSSSTSIPNTTLPYPQCLDVLKVWQGTLRSNNHDHLLGGSSSNSPSSFLNDVHLPIMNYAEGYILNTTETLIEPFQEYISPCDANFVPLVRTPGFLEGCVEHLPITGTQNDHQHVNSGWSSLADENFTTNAWPTASSVF